MPKTKMLKYAEAKGNNKRIHVSLHLDENGDKVFFVRTRTLIDFKTRNILEIDNVYSVETFMVLADLIQHFTSDSEIMNKLLFLDRNNMKPFKAKSNF